MDDSDSGVKYCDVYNEKIGNVIIVCKDNKIWKLGWKNSHKPISIEKNWKRIKSNDLAKVPILSKAKKQLEEYLAGERKEFDLPFILEGTDFRVLIWNTLKNKVKYGEMITYSELGKMAGKESSQGEDWHVNRAVGSAVGKNPLPIFIPCHRIISKSGKANYSGGVEIKEFLLELEKKSSNTSAKNSPAHDNNNNLSPKRSTNHSPSKNSANSVSKSPTKRERCKYGETCYNKKETHRKQFSHPKDSDFDENNTTDTKAGDKDTKADDQDTEEDLKTNSIPKNSDSNTTNKNNVSHDIFDNSSEEAETQEMGTTDLEQLLNKKRPLVPTLPPLRTNSVTDNVLDDSSEASDNQFAKPNPKKRKVDASSDSKSSDLKPIADPSLNSTPVVQNDKKDDQTLPLCKFGASCYRKNASHIANFRHK